MTDLERFLGFLDSAGYSRRTDVERWDDSRRSAEYYESDVEEPDYISDTSRMYGFVESDGTQRTHATDKIISYHWIVTLPEGVGYYNFRCEFYFAADGSLLTHGVWE